MLVDHSGKAKSCTGVLLRAGAYRVQSSQPFLPTGMATTYRKIGDILFPVQNFGFLNSVTGK